MGLRPAKSHEKPTGDADWPDGGADPLVRAGRPRPAAGPTISASCRAHGGRRGRRPRTRGSAPPFPEGGFSTLSLALRRWGLAHHVVPPANPQRANLESWNSPGGADRSPGISRLASG